MGVVSNIVNGYIGGHGVRLVLQVAEYDDNKFKDKPELQGAQFALSVFNFNPSNIKISNTYGWTPIRDSNSGQTFSQSQQFNLNNNEKRLELQGVIYPKAFMLLDSLLLKGITKQKPIVQQLKDLEYVGKIGAAIAVMEIQNKYNTDKQLDDGALMEKNIATDNGGVVAILVGHYFIKSFNYELSEFSYNNNPLKIEYSLTLEYKNEEITPKGG